MLQRKHRPPSLEWLKTFNRWLIDLHYYSLKNHHIRSHYACAVNSVVPEVSINADDTL